MKLELLKPTQKKKEIFEKMTVLNTQFSNWLLGYDEYTHHTSQMCKCGHTDKSNRKKHTFLA
ncbi:hypothetical protein DT065_03035 [Salicibibacter kimchii]|uniref:Transposase n=1 Tax=Salicibibacter kimchii TaxID=2099786 RepID=A0A345BVW0_9BACI|nr:hypothetical protein DT065_03035 [Salicibibacter kimchii]